MTSLTILFKEIEVDDKKKMDIQIYNFRADNATPNEKQIANILEPQILDIIKANIKNPVQYMSARWEDNLDIQAEKR